MSYSTMCVSVEYLRCGCACVMDPHQHAEISFSFLVYGDIFRLERNSFYLERLQHSLLLLFHLRTIIIHVLSTDAAMPLCL